MRAIAAVATLAGLGLVLQGCGGGGDATTCLAETMDIVSQTAKGTADVHVKATVNSPDFPDGTKEQSLTSSFTVMADFEKFNLRTDTRVSDAGMNSNTTEIINVGAEQVILYISQEISGNLNKTCFITPLKLPGDTDEKALRILWNTVGKPELQKAAVCGGNDGTYDTWKMEGNVSSIDIPAVPIPDLNVTIPPGLKIKDGKASEHVEMSKDSLIHSSSTSVSGELMNGTEVLGKLNLTTKVTVTDVQAGGPSDADLSPTQFDVNCTEVNKTAVDWSVFMAASPVGRQRLIRLMDLARSAQEEQANALVV